MGISVCTTLINWAFSSEKLMGHPSVNFISRRDWPRTGPFIMVVRQLGSAEGRYFLSCF